jgi:hypothetical protein
MAIFRTYFHRFFHYPSLLKAEQRRRQEAEAKAEEEQRRRQEAEAKAEEEQRRRQEANDLHHAAKRYLVYMWNIVRHPSDLLPALTILGFLLYGLIWVAYSTFYEDFGIEPEEVGVTYLTMTARAALGAIALVVALAFGFSIMLGISYMSDLEESIASRAEREPAFSALFYACLTASLFGVMAITGSTIDLLYPTAFSSDAMQGVPWFILPIALVVVGALILSFFLPGSTTDQSLREAINRIQLWQLSKRLALYRLSILVIMVSILAFGYPLPQAAGDRLARNVAENGPMRNLLGIHVVSVNVNWGQMKPLDLPSHPKFVYFGQSDELAVLYEREGRRLYRVPISIITLESAREF